MGPKAAKIISFYRFWTQRLTLKITPTQVQKRCPWARQAMLFPCCGGGRFWEAFSVSSRSASQSHFEVRNGPQSCKIICFYRFWTQRLTLKITPTQVQKRCPWARQAMLFPCCGGGVFGKPFRLAVQLHRKATSMCEMGPKAAKSSLFMGSRRNVCRATPRCEMGPKAAKSSVFIGSGRNVWHWRSPQCRSKNGVLELARPCCFPVAEGAFWGSLFG